MANKYERFITVQNDTVVVEGTAIIDSFEDLEVFTAAVKQAMRQRGEARAAAREARLAEDKAKAAAKRAAAKADEAARMTQVRAALDARAAASKEM